MLAARCGSATRVTSTAILLDHPVKNTRPVPASDTVPGCSLSGYDHRGFGSQVLLHRRLLPYHTTPYHTIPYRTIPYHTTPCHTIPYHTIHVPYHTIPYHGHCYRRHTIQNAASRHARASYAIKVAKSSGTRGRVQILVRSD